MSRAEFSKPTKRAAWNRSGERCEAKGALYGLPDGERCVADLNRGVEYDHVIIEYTSHDKSLENCAAVCPKCHKWKTNNRDQQTVAKVDRQWDMARNIKGPSSFRKPPGFKYSWSRRP